jgi:VWFA-related protein
MSIRLLPVFRRRSLIPSPALAAVLLVLLAVSPGLFAQTAPSKPLQHEVSVAIKLVQVYATGKDGVPVTDLTAADFEVIDNGRSYPVTHFEKHFLETGDDLAAPEASAGAVAPMNRKFFLVFDFAFMDPKAMLRAKSAALEFLDGDLQPSDEIGVVSYQAARGLVLNEYLTTDHARVRSIVEGFGARPRAGRAENLTQFIYSSDLPLLASDERATNQGAVVDPENQFYEGQARLQAGQSIGAGGRQNYVDQARQSMIALGQFAKVLRFVPGFKNIVLFSGGIARQYLYGKRGGATLGDWTTPEQLAAQLNTYDGAQASASLRDDHIAMIKEFKASNCPVYTFDVSRERMEGDVQSQGGVSGAGLREFEGEDSLRQIAGGTGGKFYAKTMDDGRVVKDIQGSTAAYYVLGYSVDETYDGKFHKIKVALHRKGVDVTTQGGYYSAKPFKDFTRFERLMHVVDLALSDTPQIQVPYDIPIAGLPLMVKGWPQLLVFARASQNVLAGVLENKAEAYLLLMDEKGDVVTIKRFTLAPSGTGKDTLYPSFLLPVKPGRYECHMVVRNMETGRAARGAAPFTVPPEKAAVLVLDPPLFVAPDTKSADLAASPGSSAAGLFGYDPEAYAPLVGDIAAGTTKLHAALRVQGGAAATGLTVTASLIDLATSVRSDVTVAILKQADDGPTRLLFMELSTGELKPGRYTLEFTAKEPGTGESAFASVEFIVK